MKSKSYNSIIKNSLIQVIIFLFVILIIGIVEDKPNPIFEFRRWMIMPLLIYLKVVIDILYIYSLNFKK